MRATEQWASTPHGEECAQLGRDGYVEAAHAECKRLIAGLLKKFGDPPQGMMFKRFANQHDFGTYYQVGVVYDDDNAEHRAYLSKVDDGFPETWAEIE